MLTAHIATILPGNFFKMKIITTKITRGYNVGINLKPHRFSSEHYFVSKGGPGGNRRENAIVFLIEPELESWIQRGYRASAKKSEN